MIAAYAGTMTSCKLFLVTHSLGGINHSVQKGYVCVDTCIVGFDVELERLFGVVVGVVVGMVSSSSRVFPL